MSEIVINASNVSQDVLLWLRRSHKEMNSNYMIERRINKEHVRSDFFKISDSFAKKLMVISVEDAWREMEEFCMNTGF